MSAVDPYSLIGIDIGDFVQSPVLAPVRLVQKLHPSIDFFPERGQSTEPAKAVCAECPVRA